jgi:hypothetical protein
MHVVYGLMLHADTLKSSLGRNLWEFFQINNEKVVKHDIFVKEEFDDTKGVNRNRKSKDRQPNGRKDKNDK